ncbi:MAG: hypothetical protein ABEJ44_04925 [Halanaeroarchaeum sp.]
MLAEVPVASERRAPPLGDDHRRITVESAGGVRHAYECDCEAVTITIAAPSRHS